MVVTIEGKAPDGTSEAKDVSDAITFTLGSCPIIGKATITKNFTDNSCSGTFDAFAVNVTKNPTYTW